MYRMILIFLMAGFSACAQAGAYSDAVDKHSRCEGAGEFAKSNYGITKEEFRSATKDFQMRVKKKEISKKLGGDAQYIVWMGYSAKSAKDAYMQAWGWCMDQK